MYGPAHGRDEKSWPLQRGSHYREGTESTGLSAIYFIPVKDVRGIDVRGIVDLIGSGCQAAPQSQTK